MGEREGEGQRRKRRGGEKISDRGTQLPLMSVPH